MDKSVKDILSKIPYDLYRYFEKNNVTELRLRSGCNITIYSDGRFITAENTFLSQKNIEDILLRFCNYTLPAYENRISQGFITIDGGHRVGIGGHFATERNKTLLKKVTSLNIRINSGKIFETGSVEFEKGLLVIGIPHSGKTTFLRSLISTLNGNITVCDERYELFSDESNCDFICGINKATAIEYATRSLNPDYIICDEIGGEPETEQILSGVNSGVKFICTAHCLHIDDVYNKPNINILIKAGVFDKIIQLSHNNDFCVKEVKNV